MIRERRIVVIVSVCVCAALAVGLYRSGIIGSRADAARQAAADRNALIESRRDAGESDYAELSIKKAFESATPQAVAGMYVPLYMEAARNVERRCPNSTLPGWRS